MKVTIRTLTVLTAGLVAALIVSAVWLAGGWTNTTQASPDIIVGFDMDPTGNTCPNNGDGVTDCTLGTIDPCVEVTTGGGVIEFDVFMDGLPSGDDIQGWEATIGGWQGTVTGRVHNNGAVNLPAQPGSTIFDTLSDPVPDSTPPHYVVVGDFAAAEPNPPFTKGVLGRYTLDTTGVGDGLYSMTIQKPGTGAGELVLGNSPGLNICLIYGCDVWDSTSLPVPHGLIAIGQSCPVPPELADVEIVSQTVLAGDCTSPAPTSLDVDTDTDLCLQKTIVNNGPTTPVDVSITVTPTFPGCLVTPNPANPTLYANLTSTPVNVDEVFTINCANPSSHSFSFLNDIAITSGEIELDDTNNSMTTPYNVDVLAEADFEVVNPAVDAPTSVGQGATFPVVVSANVNNTGPYGPATVDVTFDLALAGSSTATCSKVPDTSQAVTGITLADGAGASPSATWQVTCTTTGTADFDGDISVALASGQPHISDPDDTNDSGSASDSTNVTASADAQIVSWVFPDDMAPPAAVGAAESGDQCENAIDDDGDTVVNDGCPDIAGNQLLVEPTLSQPLDTTETLDNDPAMTTYTGPSINVGIAVTETPDANCSATPGANPTSATLLLDGTDEVDTHTWSVTLNTGDSCTIDFDKTITITTPGVNDSDLGDNSASRSVDLVADTDEDDVPDNYGYQDDNCDDDYNPDQADNDDDDIGDVCDPDDDNDGICDPGESDISCTGSDNCPLKPNAGQEDYDLDLIGDVCELDVNCTDNPLTDPDITDVVMILQYIVGEASASATACPPPAGWLYGPRMSAYNAWPNGGEIFDAVMGLQCIVGRNNIVCPVIP